MRVQKSDKQKTQKEPTNSKSIHPFDHLSLVLGCSTVAIVKRIHHQIVITYISRRKEVNIGGKKINILFGFIYNNSNNNIS